jgi:signal transduction histidine kinase/ligand-binding sensor domain-containing protein/CheY-like chemotaxis protein/HPt (histidine-containing phosphotransfer) domain-containing protein
MGGSRDIVALLLFVASMCGAAHAQPAAIRLAPAGVQPAFDTIDRQHGLPSASVLDVVADRHGFLWISGDRGVQRYDGHGFFRLDRDPNQADTLESRFIYALAECGDALWIGHPNGTVQRLDAANGTLTLFPMRYEGASPQGMLWIACDAFGQLWQMSDLGLLRLDQRGVMTRALPRSFDAMAFDPERTHLLLALPDRVVSIDVRDPERISTVFDMPPGMPGPIIAMLADATGLWLAIDRDLWRFDNADRALHRIAMPVRLFRTTFIKQSRDGALWLGSWNDDGLYRFDPARGLLSVYRHDPGDPRSLPTGITTAMALDRSNNLWIAKRESGLTRLSLGQTALTRYRPDAGSTICAMAETTLGRIVVSVCREKPMELDRNTGQLVPLPGASTLDVNSRAMISDGAGGLWITSSRKGLFHWQPDGTIRTWSLPRTQGLVNPTMTGAYLAPDGRLWISHHLGLAVLDPGATALRNVDAFEGTQRFLFDFTQDVTPGPGGTLWLSTMKGLLSYDPTTRQVRRYQNDRADRSSLSDNYLLQTWTDRGGRLWIATRAGLDRMMRDRRGRVIFRRYGVDDGLPDITIEAVLGDSQGAVWVATGRGIARWDRQRDRFQSYLPSDGIPDSDILPKSALASADGGLYLGAIDGLLRIDPRTLRIAEPAPVVLSSYEAGDTSVVNLQGAQLPGIHAHYVDGRLVAHIAVLGDARRLSYRLLGLDQTWREMPADLSIGYHWLPPGAYRLQVRQLQRDGTWGTDAALSLPIDIAPPWWRSPWAYAFYALVAIALLVAAVRAFMAWRHRALRQALEENHARLSVALNAARFGMWAWDIDADRTDLDAFTRNLLDLPVDASRLDDVYARMHPDDAGRIRAKIDEALQDDVPRDFEFRLAPEGAGDARWIEGHVVPYRRAGKSAYVIGVSRDATPRKQALSELELAKRAAEQAAAEKARFLAMMSHEIRTPINGVIGMVELLCDSPMDGEQRAQLSVCRESASLLLAIINDILDFSKIEAGKLKLDYAPLCPRSLVASVAESLQVQAKGKGIDIGVRVAPDVPRRLLGDGVRLRQVLNNLIGNAVKFTVSGGVQVSLRVLDSPAPHFHWIQFEVADTGIGMAPDTLEQLFQPFQQADSGTTRRFGGTGLGLTIVRQLVTLMGGNIGCNSAPGQGSRFCVDVPLESIDVEAFDEQTLPQVPPMRPAQMASSAPLDTTAATILIADDNAMNREVLAHQLRRLGFAFHVAEGGERAWEMLRAGHAYQLLLTDCQMPGLDGFALTRRIRDDESAAGHARLAIVAFTANVLEDERERCLDAGMDGFLTKPVQIEALRRLLSRMLPSAQSWVPSPVSAADAERLKRRLLAIFVSVTRADLETWRLARERGDREALQALAHKLKAGSLLIGEEVLTGCLEGVERHFGSEIEFEECVALAQRELEAAVTRATARRSDRHPA